MRKKSNNSGGEAVFMKNFIIPTAVAAIILACVVMMNARQGVSRMRESLDQERYQRMLLEEKLFNEETKLKSLQIELADAKNRLKTIQSVISNGDNKTADLASEVEELSKRKAELERKIQEFEAAKGLDTAGDLPMAPTATDGTF